MPLLNGYGYDVVRDNIAQLRRDGLAQTNAVAAAYSLARVSFFRRYPYGALPEWLSFPHTHRMRQHYTKSGAPRYVSQAKRQAFAENPSHANLSRAAELYEDFTGSKATHVTKHNLPDLPREGLVFGKLVQVGYESERDGRLYRHTFRPRSRPLLIATHDGKSVLIVGGRYAFTDRGIVDK